MEDNNKSELKVLSVMSDLYEEIDSHRASVIHILGNEASSIKNLIIDKAIIENSVSINKEDYNKLIQFLHRLSSFDQIQYINNSISENLSNIKYKRDLIKKLKQ